MWPPVAHIFLGWLFHVIDALGLRHGASETVLTVNILLSTVGVACLHSITLRLNIISRAALVVATRVYAFWCPLGPYSNAFVMSEHPATSALLFALWLLVRFPGYPAPLLLAGGVLGAGRGYAAGLWTDGAPLRSVRVTGRAVRESERQTRRRVFRLALSSSSRPSRPRVNRISNGQLLGLSANGGVNFYFAQCPHARSRK
ncbi:MAG: hypothetical protein IPG64_19645 [Haliea sp.]|nr:hypothetical protein [Haliea sp.]